MVGWHHELNGQESEQTPRDAEGQLACQLGDSTTGRQSRALLEKPRQQIQTGTAGRQSAPATSKVIQDGGRPPTWRLFRAGGLKVGGPPAAGGKRNAHAPACSSGKPGPSSRH